MLYFWFLDEKNFSQDQRMNSQNNPWIALSLQGILIVMKIKYPVHIMIFVMFTCNSDIMPLFTFPYGLTLYTEAYIKCLSWIEKVPAEDSTFGNRTLCHVIPVELSLGWEKISTTTSLLTSSQLNPQITIPLIIKRGVQLRKRPTKHCATLKINWKQG